MLNSITLGFGKVTRPYNHTLEWEEADSAAGDDDSFTSRQLEAVAAKLVALNFEPGQLWC